MKGNHGANSREKKRRKEGVGGGDVGREGKGDRGEARGGKLHRRLRTSLFQLNRNVVLLWSVYPRQTDTGVLHISSDLSKRNLCCLPCICTLSQPPPKQTPSDAGAK